MGERCLGRHTARDDVGWRRGLGDPAFAGSARVFGTTRDNHPELRGDDVQPFADIFADDMALGSAGAGELGFNGNPAIFNGAQP